jgi:septal ring factor EnvC (AmiA/AmiB activator)
MTRKQIAGRVEYLFKEYQTGRMTASKLCKRIAELEAESAALAAELAEVANEPPTLEQIAEYMDEIGLLKQQIEKMKCCANCGALEPCECDGCDRYKHWRPRQ